jgi:hypothetical protein
MLSKYSKKCFLLDVLHSFSMRLQILAISQLWQVNLCCLTTSHRQCQKYTSTQNFKNVRLFDLLSTKIVSEKEREREREIEINKEKERERERENER